MRNAYAAMMDYLDRTAFPALVGAVVFPMTIVFDVLLLPLLIIFKDATAVVLLANSYLNVCSAAVASIILREDRKNKATLADIQETHERHHREHQIHFAGLHAKIDDLARMARDSDKEG